MLSIETTAFIVAPHAIKVLQSAGYKLVTVAECLGQQPYLSTGPPTAVRFSSPFIFNNTLIDIMYILFVGHMVLLNIGLTFCTPQYLILPLFVCSVRNVSRCHNKT